MSIFHKLSALAALLQALVPQRPGWTQAAEGGLRSVQVDAADVVADAGIAPGPGADSMGADRVRGGRYTVPLHRQRVPVRSEDMVVSFKSVYFGTVTLGLPLKQSFTVVFDTGSGHVIVPSIQCLSETCMLHHRFDREASPNAVDVDYDGTVVAPGAPRDQITVAFGTGEVTGQFVYESLCLGVGLGGEAAEAVAPPAAEAARAAAEFVAKAAESPQEPGCVALRIVTATEMTHEPFASFTFDGVLGLGLDGLALTPEFSFFGMMAKQGEVTAPSFGVFLADSDDEFSEITFGGHNPDRVDHLAFAPVASPELGYWQVAITRIRVGNKSLSFCDDGKCRAVVDTGTSLLAVPLSFAEELQLELEGSLRDPPEDSNGVVNCKRSLGAVLQFDVEGTTITLHPGDYSRQAIQLSAEDRNANLPFDASKGSAEVTETNASLQAFEAAAESLAAGGGEEARCHPTIMPIDFPEPLGPKLFIWGEPVLRKYYTTYDWQKKRIGFGVARHTHEGEDADDDQLSPPLPGASPLLQFL